MNVFERNNKNNCVANKKGAGGKFIMQHIYFGFKHSDFYILGYSSTSYSMCVLKRLKYLRIVRLRYDTFRAEII